MCGSGKEQEIFPSTGELATLWNKTCSIRQDRSHTILARHHDFVCKYMNSAGYSSEEVITGAGLDGLFGMPRLGLGIHFDCTEGIIFASTHGVHSHPDPSKAF